MTTPDLDFDSYDDDERCDYCGRWVDVCNENPCLPPDVAEEVGRDD